MSVSVSQIGTGRSLDRSIDQSQFPGQFLDQSICVCRCLYKEQHTPTRSHFCRKILRLVDLFFISSFHPLNLSLGHYRLMAYLRSHDVARTSQSQPRGLSRRFSNDCTSSQSHLYAYIKHRTNPRTRRRIHDAGRTKSRETEKVHTK